jgi:uncharacterized protein
VEIAIVSDTQMPRGSRRLPDECVARLVHADLVIHAGDLITIDVLSRLRTYGPVVAVRFPDTDAVVFGHSHIPLHERAPDGFQIFNPGSPTDRRRQPRHTMGLCHVQRGALEFELIDLD